MHKHGQVVKVEHRSTPKELSPAQLRRVRGGLSPGVYVEEVDRGAKPIE
jgi:hypothetical protein